MKSLLDLFFAVCIFQFGALAAPNVLFIAIDDLRPALGCYGDAVAISPNIDRLASQGTTFNRAYCQLAVCGPSRHSLLSGRRPDTIEVWDLNTHFRATFPNLVSLPQHFKDNGYHTRSIGKIYHGNGTPSKDGPSWSEDPIFDNGRNPEWRYASPENLAGTGLKRAASEGVDTSDSTFVDGMVCDAALDALDAFKERKQPFFLGVGFRKPHLPFVAPKRYWNLYDRSDISEPASNKHPQGAPEFALRSWNELEGYTDIPKDASKLSPAKVQELRHGYYACISYVDALIGRLLDRLDELGFSENTVVCLWGDHGFHLGEQGLWTKANNYELAARVPLIVSTPGQKAKGVSSNAFVELVDLYPTLADVCGLRVSSELEGLSMMPLLDDPNLFWKTAAFNQYPRMFEGVRHERHGDVMGYSVRTDRFRFVQWKNWKSGEIEAEELYDHRNDFDEMRNVAGNPEYFNILVEHQQRLKVGWRGALPIQKK
ncbi:MAG: sulfatase [Opitutaceae bacterium]|jgi:iduronate 2-sulfatase|nr:sulfatase [Opitutaceae bacterium]